MTVVIRSLGRPHLASALASVARQTHREIEVLMVDATGGKHPSMADRCGDFPLRFVSGSRTLNRPEAANRGLDYARGAWIIFLDDDDFFEPGHIASLLKAAKENQTVVAYAGTRMLDGNDQAIGELNERYSRLKLCAGNFMQMGAVLFHRNLLQQGCRFDERMLLYQDWDFWLQLSRFSHFAHAAEITNNWRIHTGESGAGAGENANLVLQAEFTAKVKDKWQPHHDRLIEFVHNTVRRSNQQISTGRANRAVKWLRRALTAMPNDPTLTNLLGLAKYKAGDLTGAWHALDDAHALLPENDAIGRNLVQVEKLRRTRRSK
ncbi:MAG: glycosyltransferase [Betaproteobacteria bacterium]|nr:glycosyltransferase [Betaproteobacteria bacterium]